MTMSVLEKEQEREITPCEVRNMLGIDNAGIRELCKKAEIKMKRNERGLTYFTGDDVKKIKDVSSSFKKGSLMTVPVSSGSTVIKKIENETSFLKLMDTLKSIESTITSKVSSLLDEKLDGMDDVVMELIRVKTENETLRFKINELNKENYRLKKELNSFQKAPFGFYTKKETSGKMF